jgi:hypothetical protein
VEIVAIYVSLRKKKRRDANVNVVVVGKIVVTYVFAGKQIVNTVIVGKIVKMLLKFFAVLTCRIKCHDDILI